jgi:hypothetical protein
MTLTYLTICSLARILHFRHVYLSALRFSATRIFVSHLKGTSRPETEKARSKTGLPLNFDSLYWRRDNPKMAEFKTGCKRRRATEFYCLNHAAISRSRVMVYPPLSLRLSPPPHCLAPILKARFLGRPRFRDRPSDPTRLRRKLSMT